MRRINFTVLQGTGATWIKDSMEEWKLTRDSSNSKNKNKGLDSIKIQRIVLKNTKNNSKTGNNSRIIDSHRMSKDPNNGVLGRKDH